MKNEDRIIDLLVEALQRIDQHSEQFNRVHEELQKQSEELQKQRGEMYKHGIVLIEQRDDIKLQQEIMLGMLAKLRRHDEIIERHSMALVGLKERTEEMHQSALEQQKAYQVMTELLMFHNRALRAKDIL